MSKSSLVRFNSKSIIPILIIIRLNLKNGYHKQTFRHMIQIILFYIKKLHKIKEILGAKI